MDYKHYLMSEVVTNENSLQCIKQVRCSILLYGVTNGILNRGFYNLRVVSYNLYVSTVDSTFSIVLTANFVLQGRAPSNQNSRLFLLVGNLLLRG